MSNIIPQILPGGGSDSTTIMQVSPLWIYQADFKGIDIPDPTDIPEVEVPQPTPIAPDSIVNKEGKVIGPAGADAEPFAKVVFYSSHAINIEGGGYHEAHSPFFYDHEIEDVQFSARLYPSTGWVDDDSAKVAGWFPLHKSILRTPELEKNNGYGGDVKYSKIPIVQSIYSEDFNVSAANDWNDANFGTDLQDSMNRGKVFVPYLQKVSKWGKIAAKDGETYLNQLEERVKNGKVVDAEEEKTGLSINALKVMRTANSWGEKLTGLLDTAAANLDKTSIIQGTRFSYYSGTGISFGNLVMRFTLFSDFKYKSYYSKEEKKYVCEKETRFVPVNEQLSQLYDYSIGKYYKWLDVYSKGEAEDEEKAGNKFVKTGGIKSKSMREANRQANIEAYMENNSKEIASGTKSAEWSLDEISEQSKAFLNTFMGWQSAPGGYKPKPEDIDAIMMGTFRLEIGTHYVIENLVIQDIQFNYSRQMAKYPMIEGEKIKINYAPLYCDVQITLRPATKFTDDALRKFTDFRPKEFLNKINKNIAGVNGADDKILTGRTVKTKEMLDVYLNKSNNVEK